MMLPRLLVSAVITFSVCLVTTLRSYSASCQIAETAVAAKIVTDQALALANQITNKAQQTGDYLMGRAGIEARVAIENWRVANSDILDKAFNSVAKEHRAVFDNIKATLDGLNRKTIDTTEAMRQIAESGEQIANIIDWRGFRSYVIRYQPTIVYPGKVSPRLLKVRRVNLDEVSVTLNAGHKVFRPRVPNKQGLFFELPEAFYDFPSSQARLATLQLQYDPLRPGLSGLVGKRANVKRDIVIMLLPVVMGTYSYTTRVDSTNRVWQRRDSQLEQFKGSNDDLYKAIPATAGWLIDLSTLSFRQLSGEAGSCIGFTSENRTPQGVTFKAHVDRIKNWQRDAPGYVNCAVAFQEYQDVTIEADGPKGPDPSKNSIGARMYQLKCRLGLNLLS